jgi:hypothetical protein
MLTIEEGFQFISEEEEEECIVVAQSIFVV